MVSMDQSRAFLHRGLYHQCHFLGRRPETALRPATQPFLLTTPCSCTFLRPMPTLGRGGHTAAPPWTPWNHVRPSPLAGSLTQCGGPHVPPQISGPNPWNLDVACAARKGPAGVTKFWISGWGHYPGLSCRPTTCIFIRGSGGRFDTWKGRRVTVGQTVEGHSHKPRHIGSHWKLQEARNRPSLRASGGARPCQCLNFVALVMTLASERGHLCHFKPLV